MKSANHSPDVATRAGLYFLRIMFLLALTSAPSQAADITYLIDEVTMSGGTRVSGTITTDGTLGRLAPTRIVDYQFEADYREASPQINPFVGIFSPVWSYDSESQIRFKNLVATSSALILEPPPEDTATLEITGWENISLHNRTQHDLFWSTPTSEFDSRGIVGAKVRLEGNYAQNPYVALYFVDQWSGLDTPLQIATVAGAAPPLQAGDANQDFDFNQLDIVQVLQVGKYLTGEPATWGEGDWDGAPGGYPGNPPPGDGLFDQKDIIAALNSRMLGPAPYAVVQPNGEAHDGQTSIVYSAGTGELAVDTPTGIELTSINIDSAADIFTGDAAQNLSGSFDNDADDNIFKATFGGSFGSLSFANVAQAGLAEDTLLGDQTVIGSLQGGGALGDVDLNYVPEPTGLLLLVVGAFAIAGHRHRQSNVR